MDDPRPFAYLMRMAQSIADLQLSDDESLNELASAAVRDWLAESPDGMNGPANQPSLSFHSRLPPWLWKRLGGGWFSDITELQASIGGPVLRTPGPPFGTGSKPRNCIWTGSIFESGRSSWFHIRELLAMSSSCNLFTVRPGCKLLKIESAEDYARLSTSFGNQYPDIRWDQVARDFDGVHVSTRAILTAPRRRGMALASWTTESTAWFTDTSLKYLGSCDLPGDA